MAARLMDLALDDRGLASRGVVVPLDQVRGFVERYDRWTGRLSVEVVGPGWRIPIAPGWGELRRELRAALPDRPFTSAWERGRFPAAPLGLPGDLVFGVAVLVTAAVSAAVAQEVGLLEAAVVAVVAGWPLVRLRDAVGLFPRGFSAGPPGSGTVRWDEVEAVFAAPRGRTALVWARTRHGVSAAAVPIGLLPAVRARVSRLGGLPLGIAEPDLDARYAAWREPARGIPWGVAIGTALVAGFTADPAWTLTIGLAVAAATAVLGSAAEARATGWGFGGVVWLTVLYGGFIALLGISRLY